MSLSFELLTTLTFFSVTVVDPKSFTTTSSLDLELDFAAWSLSAFSTVVDFSVSLSASFAEVLASPSICELLAVDFDVPAAEELLSEEVVFVFSLL